MIRKPGRLAALVAAAMLTVVIAPAACASEAMDAQAKLAEGAVAYFRDRGSTEAVRILTDPAATKYLSAIHLGDKDDASNVDRMIAAANWVTDSNTIRRRLGLPELRSSDTLMAMAIADADIARTTHDHPRQYAVGENLAWMTITNPYTLWYDNEKPIYDQAVAKDPTLKTLSLTQFAKQDPDLYEQVGHYLNLIQPSYAYTGYGVAYNGPQSTHSQLFAYTTTVKNPGRIMTVTEYRDDLTQWVDDLKAKLPEADKTALNATIRAAEAKKETDWTPASWANLQTALDHARTVNTSPDSTQTQVDDATTLLNRMITALTPRDATVKPADKTTLQNTIHQAERLQAKDWTAATWRTLLDALTKANTVNSDPAATQTTVDTADATLADAIRRLTPASGGTTAPSTARVVVYRAFNPNATGAGSHLYTTSIAELNAAVHAGWRDEGVKLNVAKDGRPVYRVYNPNNGAHHYTMSATERDMLTRAGWRDEGVAWHVADGDPDPVHRDYNPNTGEHVYTTDRNESDNLVRHGWRDEGIAFNARAV